MFFSPVFSALSLFLFLLLSCSVELVASSPIVTARSSPQRHDGQAPLQPTRPASHTQIMTPTPATSTIMTAAARLKRDDESAAAALLSSSIQSVLATGLPLSILYLAATNPAAASTWLASEVLVLQQQQQNTAYAATATTTVPTPSWYRALPTDVKAYLLAAADSMVAAAEVAATATGSSTATATSTATSEDSSSSTSASESSSDSAADASKSYAIAGPYHMSGAAVAGVLLGSVGFVGACALFFAWRARLGVFRQLGRRPSGEVEGYERAASRAALRREFKGSRLDVDVIVQEAGDVEMGGMVGERDGKGKGKGGGDGKGGMGGGGAEEGAEGQMDADGRMAADRESVVTALPRYRPSIFGNTAGWKAEWPSAWMSGR